MGTRTRIIGIAAALAAGATLFAAAPAHANPSISFSISSGVPYGYAQPGYVYAQPGYVYGAPGYYQPSYPYPYPQASFIYYDDGHRHRHHHHRHYHGGGRADRDGDGVPNRFDRRPNNPRRY